LAGEELAFVKTLLENDVRNNSAWNQRYFVFLDLFGNFSEEALAKEVAETWEFVNAALRNESSWSYLRGIINLADPDFRMSLQKEVLSMCKPLLKIAESVPMTALYVDLIDELLSAGEDAYIKDYGEAISALDNLTSIDPIRALYWEFVKRKFMAAHAEIAEQKGCCLSS
ncbi:Protein farnesyltransferase/geranylgeranyltransferase type-1 subunit alpha, partial [Orchesella cincta]